MYTVTFSNEELEEMKANDAVVIVSCDDDNGHRLCGNQRRTGEF